MRASRPLARLERRTPGSLLSDSAGLGRACGIDSGRLLARFPARVYARNAKGARASSERFRRPKAED